MDRIRSAGKVIKSYRGRKTMIICDKDMLKLGYTHEVIKSLIAKPIEYVLFSDVGKHIQDELIMSCLEQASINNVDSIVAIGNKDVMAFHQNFQAKSQVQYPSYEIVMESNVG